MDGGEAVIVAGLGCRRHCPAEEVLALVRRALVLAGRGEEALAALAAPAFKSGEAGLHEAAARLGRPLRLIAAERLAELAPLCPTRSRAALRAHGIASIAESAALAGAGLGGRLVLPRIESARATCALAEEARP